MQNTENILPDEVETTTTPINVELPCVFQHLTVRYANDPKTDIVAPVYTCYIAPSKEEIATAIAALERDENGIIKGASTPQESATVGEQLVRISTVPDDHEAGRMLVIMQTPGNYRVLALLRESFAEQDKADMLAVYNAILMYGERQAFFFNDKVTEIVPEDDPRAVTFIFDPARQKIVFRVRESDRRNDVRRLSKRLKDKHVRISQIAAANNLEATEGGYVDAS